MKKLRSARGPAGPTGERGPTGKTGPQGPTGAAGPKLKRADVVAMLDDQLSQLRQQLDVHLTRMGQIQQQLDQIHSVVKQLLRQGRDSR